MRESYQQLLDDQEAIDFNDMINQAIGYIQEGRWRIPYRYVLVDEFQDISAGRIELLKALKRTGLAFFVVGDDWQSIYRFAGSDVRLVNSCDDYLGWVKEQTLKYTFRFSNGILGPSTAFIQRNPEQTQRPLRTKSDAEDGGVTIVFDNNPIASGCNKAIEDIRAMQGGQPSLLILGRYKYISDCLPTNLRRQFSTVHAAKGREADYVIVLDLKNARSGFPSRKEDDPLLDLVLPPVSGETYPFAEERRLFYVAMTRARNGTYLVTDSMNPSTFVKELLEGSEGLRQIGDELGPQCINCTNGRLVVSKSGKNMRCSNHPYCRYLAPRCTECNTGYWIIADQPCTNTECGSIAIPCPRCLTGILVERPGPRGPFLGCTMYRPEPPCEYTQNI